jgi:hypothetical protein
MIESELHNDAGCKYFTFTLNKREIGGINVDYLPEDKYKWFSDILKNQMIKAYQMGKQEEKQKVSEFIKGYLDIDFLTGYLK